MKQHTGWDHTLFEKQKALEIKGCLVMQNPWIANSHFYNIFTPAAIFFTPVLSSFVIG